MPPGTDLTADQQDLNRLTRDHARPYNAHPRELIEKRDAGHGALAIHRDRACVARRPPIAHVCKRYPATAPAQAAYFTVRGKSFQATSR